ncbi:MAG: glucose 1-dehydrogenase [Dehalococcoidia bacterium]|nr:glucose 1-dehydrogenase [Dehalococcoidia bacterium]
MTKKLIDRVALVTGGGTGIGESICKIFAAEGAWVVVTDVNKQTAEKVAQDINSSGGMARAYEMDVTCGDNVRAVVSDIFNTWKKIDILVNNAGGGTEEELFLNTNESMWDKCIALNLKGTLLPTHAVLPSMIERRYGKIINISSLAGKMGQGGYGLIYSACKAGVDVFAKALARDVARYNINVNSICPGTIDTQLLYSVPGLLEAMSKRTPMKRVGKPEDIACAALFLASDDANYITGHSMPVDGGVSMI